VTVDIPLRERTLRQKAKSLDWGPKSADLLLVQAGYLNDFRFDGTTFGVNI
jgi:hypothetical protein